MLRCAIDPEPSLTPCLGGPLALWLHGNFIPSLGLSMPTPATILLFCHRHHDLSLSETKMCPVWQLGKAGWLASCCEICVQHWVQILGSVPKRKDVLFVSSTLLSSSCFWSKMQRWSLAATLGHDGTLKMDLMYRGR